MTFLKSHFTSILLFILGLILAFVLSRNEAFQSLLLHVGTFGYIGVFLAGVFFVSTFTIATAILMLVELRHFASPLTISLIAGLGATVCNYIIFLLISRKIVQHIRTFFKKGTKKHQTHQLGAHTHWLLPLLGVVILASPFPDEIGIFLLRMFNMKTYQFLIVSFILKFIGIFLVATSFHYLL